MWLTRGIYLALIFRDATRRRKLFAARGGEMWFNDLAESLRIGRFHVKYIVKLALIAVVPALLIIGSVNAAQRHHHKARRAHHHASRHHGHTATKHQNPNQ
jgi:hypothetical protein